jgi:putative oxidoreductase
MTKFTNTGRIIFAIPFAIFGINQFINYNLLALLYTTFIPIGPFTNVIIGVALIAASISIIINKYVRISCLLLAALLLIFIVTIHLPQLLFHYVPSKLDPDFAQILIITNLLKDLGLMGGALMIAGLSPTNNNN